MLLMMLMQESYLSVIDELDNKKYVSNMDLLQEAMDFSKLSSDKMIDILKYVLEYNAEVYEKQKDIKEESKEEENDFVVDNHQEEMPPFGSTFENSFENYDSENVEKEETEDNQEYQEFHFNDVVKDDFTNFTPLSFYNYDDEKKEEENDATYIPVVEDSNEIEEESVADNDIDISEERDEDEVATNEKEEEIVWNPPVEDNSYPQEDVEEDEKVSTNDLHKLLGKYDIKEDNTYINELVVGDVKNYEDVLDILNENNLIDSFKNNSELLVETLLCSNSGAIKEVLSIIKNDLSVDDEDYLITTHIVIDTLPSVFISQDGNYNNFIRNIKIFKELDLNLINLFDFSKEIFIANHDTIVNNLDIVKKYNVDITYQNAKYLLLLPSIGDRLDYYVESVYQDNVKNEVFDGIEYINLYTAKLNVVTDETIKRLRYSSENGKKLFGSKPKSLVGDITNLKVNSLDITGEYLGKFFNNEFDNLTGEETRKYIKLIHNSSNVGDYNDELDILDKYHDGLRYVIEGINISYNKVLRNYSILRSYGIDKKKALHFAVCYNLVITKDEYDKLKDILDEIGGEE